MEGNYSEEIDNLKTALSQRGDRLTILETEQNSRVSEVKNQVRWHDHSYVLNRTPMCSCILFRLDNIWWLKFTYYNQVAALQSEIEQHELGQKQLNDQNKQLTAMLKEAQVGTFILYRYRLYSRNCC